MKSFRRDILQDRHGLPLDDIHIAGMQGPPAAFDKLMRMERADQAAVNFAPEDVSAHGTAFAGLGKAIANARFRGNTGPVSFGETA